MISDEKVESTQEYDNNGQEYENNGLVLCKLCDNPCEETSPICDDCRQKLIRYPIPKKILLFLILVIGIVAISMFTRFPTALRAGMNYERALQAMEQKNYVDAEIELNKAYSIIPNSPDITGNLAICTYMNMDIVNLFELLNHIYNQNMEFKDEELFNRLTSIYETIGIILDVPEEFANDYNRISEGQISAKIEELTNYSEKYPDSVYIKMALADILFDEKQFELCERKVQEVLQVVPSFASYQLFMVAIDREKGNFDEAEAKCMELLNDNHQSTSVLVALSRIELKRLNDKKSLEYMETAYAIQPEEIGVLLDLARSYYYNNEMEKLNSIMDTIEKNPQADMYQEEILEMKGIIEGRIQWR